MSTFTDISNLVNKRDNEEQRELINEEQIPPEETLSAEDFVEGVIKPIMELQKAAAGAVKKIKQGGIDYVPDANGVITLQGAETSLRILTEESTSEPLVIIDGIAKLHLRLLSVQNQADTFEEVTIEVATAPIGGTAFTTRGSFTMRAVASSSESYTEKDITEFLAMGEQQVMLTAHGSTTSATTAVLFSNITLSTLKLEFATEWWKPMSGSIRLAYKIYGSIAKTLTIKIDGITIVNGKAVNGVYTEVPYSDGLEFSGASYCTHGVHKISAYLTAGTQSTEPIENEIFFSADNETDKTFLVVNDLATTALPYVDSTLFNYAVFKNGETAADVVVKITNNDSSETYLSQDLGAVPTAIRSTYIQALEVESTLAVVPMYVWFYTKDEDGELVPMSSSLVGNRSYALISVDNSVSYAPTAMQSGGLIINPKVRSNSENSPKTIINGLDGNIVPSTWEGFGLINDGWITENKVSFLRVPANRQLTIDYDPFSQLINAGSTASVTIEMDVRISNLRDSAAEDEPVLDICTLLSVDNMPIGLRVLPLRAFLMTMNQRNINSQDISYQEDARTHIAVNIVSDLYGSGNNYVRFFVNGRINREFSYVNDQFAAASGSGGIKIGSTSADIDIYGIRVYRQALSAANIMQDYKSSLPTAAEKNAFQTENDILGDNNTIDYDKCQGLKMNTLLSIPEESGKNLIPNYTNNGSNVSKTTLIMYVYNEDGSLNKKYTQKCTAMKQKGQGTSSMTYFKWNVTFQSTEKSLRYTIADDGTWVLDESVSGEKVYMLFPNGTRKDIKSIKNVAKINWASSMQSHKMGSVNGYTDLHRKCVSNNAQFIEEQGGSPDYRPSCMQIPVMFFVQSDPTNSGTIEFYNQFTIGAGKGDKPTFGNKATSALYNNQSIYTMLEGSTNGAPLPERKIPWLTDEIFYYINPANENDGKNETFVYGIDGDSQLDFDAGIKVEEADGIEHPKGFTKVDAKHWQETEDLTFGANNADGSPNKRITGGNTIKYFRRAYNFDFEHSFRLRSIANKDALDSRTDLDTDYQYWVQQASGAVGTNGRVNQYDLFRWNPLTRTWVNAGTAHANNTEDGYARQNLMTQCQPWFTKYNITYSAADPNLLNEAFIKARIQHYYECSGWYYNETDCDFSQAFRKIFALSDNWCKNTYEYVAPDGLICEASDDNDTMADIDNVGASKKPYFVEEHDRCTSSGDYDENGSSTYWNSDTNVRYCLREKARESEIAAMVGSILNAMTTDHSTIYEWFEDYFFKTYKVYPAIVYNEVAKLLYETAKTAMSNNQYTNNTDPLTQSLGDHQQAERQWWKRRIPYMASYSNASEFANKSGVGSFSFRSVLNVDGTSPSYRFSVTAHQWIYPSASKDGTLVTTFRKRMKAGETFVFPELITSDGNTNIMLNGADYYTSFGNLTGFSIGGDTLNISGKRLAEFIVDGTDGNFRPAAVAFAAPRLQRVEIKNVDSITGAPDLSGSSILKVVNFSGCSKITSLGLPESDTLTHVTFPPNINSLKLVSLPNLETINVTGNNSIATIIVQKCAQKAYNYVLDLVAVLLAR